METHYFAFRDGKIVLVEIPPKKISEKEFSGDQWKENHANKEYEQALQSAIKNGKEVSNQNEVRDILWHSTQDVALEENKLYPLQCRVDILPWSTLRIYSTGGAHKQMPVHGNGARVTFDEQPEKYYCQTCKAEINEGEFKTFGVCDNCWDFHYRKPEAAGQEQDLPEWVADKINDKKQILELQEQTASLQKQLEELREQHEERVSSIVKEKNRQMQEYHERIAKLEEALNTSGDLILATQAYLATISGINIKFGKKEFQELDALATKHAKQLQALQSPPGESEKPKTE